MILNELLVRKTRGKHHNSLSPFSTKLRCGDCGAYYGSKVWHSTDKYRRIICQCNGKFKRECKCKTPHLYEKDIKCYDGYAKRFNKAKNKYYSLQKPKVTRTFQVDIIECFMFEIDALMDLPIEYSDRL